MRRGGASSFRRHVEGRFAGFKRGTYAISAHSCNTFCLRCCRVCPWEIKRHNVKRRWWNRRQKRVAELKASTITTTITTNTVQLILLRNTCTITNTNTILLGIYSCYYLLILLFASVIMHLYH